MKCRKQAKAMYRACAWRWVDTYDAAGEINGMYWLKTRAFKYATKQLRRGRK